MEHYGIGMEEAVGRIERQGELGDLAQSLEQKLGGLWAGCYIDQADGGRLVILSTDVAAARTVVVAVPSELREFVVVRAAKHSAAELAAEQARIRGILRSEQIAPVQIGPDTARNELIVGIYQSVPPADEGGSPESIRDRVAMVLREADSFALVEMLDHGPPRFMGGPVVSRNPSDDCGS